MIQFLKIPHNSQFAIIQIDKLELILPFSDCVHVYHSGSPSSLKVTTVTAADIERALLAALTDKTIFTTVYSKKEAE